MLMERLKKFKPAGYSSVHWEVARMIMPSFVPSDDLARILMDERLRTVYRDAEPIRPNRPSKRGNQQKRAY